MLWLKHNIISGDSCCFSFSLGGIKKLIENRIPNIYVYSIRLGNNEIEVGIFVILNYLYNNSILSLLYINRYIFFEF